ncbi:hypothetical protein [Bradyrhizobium cosmicum]|uniref:hypothetical protein n=1 Tax=Bradyrhizobium cosmicum TaxID=1404864 RepID=UPI0028EE08CE|nr:hypothetical protein [Bradyrhizobium cosmicum]
MKVERLGEGTGRPSFILRFRSVTSGFGKLTLSNEENEGVMPADWPWTDSTRSTQPIGRPLRPIDEAAAVSTHDLADNFYALGVLPNKVDVLSFLLGAQFDAAKKAVAARCISSDAPFHVSATALLGRRRRRCRLATSNAVEGRSLPAGHRLR